MHTVWYTAMSMDGRIASASDSLDFLDTIGPEDPRETDDDWAFDRFIARVDAVVIGATTLRWLLRGGHGWPHGDLPTWLVSHDASLLDQVDPTEAPLVRREGNVAAVFDEVERSGARYVWMCGGGSIAGQALVADRIDEVVVTIAPTALGAGSALFDGVDLPIRRFRLDECRAVGGNAARVRWTRAEG